jgi:membrane protein
VVESEKAAAQGGRLAARPSDFSGRAWRRVLARVWVGHGRDHVSIIAAGVAFFATFSIFPAIAALIALYGLLADPAEVQQSLQSARPVLPPDVFSIIETQVTQVVAAGNGKLGLASVVSLGIALWSARAGVTALIEGLNIVYREEEQRSLLRVYLTSLLLTFMVILIAIVALFAVVAVPAALGFVRVGWLAALLARVVPLVILAVAVVFAIGALYRYGPDRAAARKRWLTVGAVFATGGWALVSLGLSIYFARFAHFNETYGSLGAIIGLLFWLYASALVVLVGGQVNAEMELETERDTTTGKPRPMGERGAYVADHVA